MECKSVLYWALFMECKSVFVARLCLWRSDLTLTLSFLFFPLFRECNSGLDLTDIDCVSFVFMEGRSTVLWF